MVKLVPLVRTALSRGWSVPGRPTRFLDATVVAICHCHHPELVPELSTALRRLPAEATLHITSSRNEVLDRWRSLRRRPLAETCLHRVENRGRDIRPFFEVARTLSLSPETLVLKLHGKMSSYSALGERWRQDLLAGLLPRRSALQRVSARFRDDARLGVLGASHSFISHPVYWGRNRENVSRIMAQICGFVPNEEDLGFFAGSMFWLRGTVLSDILPHVDLDAFEPEPLPQDGAYAHAIERVIPMVARQRGWHLGEIGSPEILHPDAVRQRKLRYL